MSLYKLQETQTRCTVVWILVGLKSFLNLKWPPIKKVIFQLRQFSIFFLWTFHGLVLGLVGKIDAKGIDVAQPISQKFSRKILRISQALKMTFVYLFVCLFFGYWAVQKNFYCFFSMKNTKEVHMRCCLFLYYRVYPRKLLNFILL